MVRGIVGEMRLFVCGGREKMDATRMKKAVFGREMAVSGGLRGG